MSSTVPISAHPVLVLLGVPTLWTAACVLAWVGLVRHSYRAYRARVDRAVIRATGTDGLLRFAAEEALRAERFRSIIKLGLLLYAALTLWRGWDRLDETAGLWDWRDLAAPLLFLMVLVLLTLWSNADADHRPQLEPAVEPPPC